MPATASTVVEMVNGKRGEEEDALRFFLFVLIIALSFHIIVLVHVLIFVLVLEIRLLLGIDLKQSEEGAEKELPSGETGEEQVSIFYNYSADELVGNDEDTTEAFEAANVVGYCGLNWSVPENVAENLEVEEVPDPDHLDPLNLMGEAIVAPPIALQTETSPIQTSPNRKSPGQSSPLSSSPLQNSHILNTPVQANTVQHEEQQDEDMMAAAIPLISILQKQQEGEEGGLSQAIRADLIQVSPLY